MTRHVGRLWAGMAYPAGTSDHVEDYSVTPHRYLWDAPYDPREDAERVSVWRGSVPYDPGEVVWLQVGSEAKRALIIAVFPYRNSYGERKAQFRVRLETKAGTCSKLHVAGLHPTRLQAGRAGTGR